MVSPTRLTALIVEREPTVRKMLSVIAQSEGFETLEAAGPEEAGRLFDEYGSLIAMMLVEIDGSENRGSDLAIHCMGRSSKLNVVFLSAYGVDRRTMENAVPWRAQILNKPFHLKDLVGYLRAGSETNSRLHLLTRSTAA